MLANNIFIFLIPVKRVSFHADGRIFHSRVLQTLDLLNIPFASLSDRFSSKIFF